MTMRQSQYLVAKDRTLQIIFEVSKPMRRSNDRRSLADHRVGEADAVGCRAILDFLMHRSITGAPGRWTDHSRIAATTLTMPPIQEASGSSACAPHSALHPGYRLTLCPPSTMSATWLPPSPSARVCRNPIFDRSLRTEVRT